jgi:hypothetical protein
MGARLFMHPWNRAINRRVFPNNSDYFDYFVGALAARGGKVDFIPHRLAH